VLNAPRISAAVNLHSGGQAYIPLGTDSLPPSRNRVIGSSNKSEGALPLLLWGWSVNDIPSSGSLELGIVSSDKTHTSSKLTRLQNVATVLHKVNKLFRTFQEGNQISTVMNGL
jgi:hypothetical protein